MKGEHSRGLRIRLLIAMLFAVPLFCIAVGPMIFPIPIDLMAYGKGCALIRFFLCLPVLGAAAMSLSSVSVATNAPRLNIFRP